MPKFTLELDNFGEVIALHRALMEAKYQENPNDLDLRSSPLLSNVLHKVTDLVLQEEPDEHNWRSGEGMEGIVTNIRLGISKAGKYWDGLDDEQRLDYVAILIAPFRPSRERLAAFLGQALQDES